MTPFWSWVINWLPPAFVGLTFLAFGCIKVYGLVRGIEGGGGKPFTQRLCGT
jgi:hypothetical protein